MADAGISGKPAVRGYASLRSKTGAVTGETAVLVSKNELVQFSSKLGPLYTTFSKKQKKVERADVSQHLFDLQKALASIVSGQEIARTDLRDVINDLPLHTESMMMTNMQIADMETTEFDTWLEKLKTAKDAIESRCSSDDWMQVGQVQYTFFPFALLP